MVFSNFTSLCVHYRIFSRLIIPKEKFGSQFIDKLMIFVSSSCIKRKKIGETIEYLAKNNFYNIELSGGTFYYKDLKKDILELKNEYGLTFLVHNYFPPPKKDFIINLASMDENIHSQSLNHCKNAIALAIEIEAKKISFHAGFFFDPENLGFNIPNQSLYNKLDSTKKFIISIKELKKFSGDKIQIYFENNVLSSRNAQNFKGENPFLLTSLKEYRELSKLTPFKLLFDIAHLKISANSLSFNFLDDATAMLDMTDYIHISDNDGYSDQNLPISKESSLIYFLENYNFKLKTITIEVYGNINEIKETYQLIESYII